jgi:hypothetical protein
VINLEAEAALGLAASPGTCETHWAGVNGGC